MTDELEWQRPGGEREPKQTFRCNATLWNAAVVIAGAKHESVSGILRAALRNYVRNDLPLLSPAQRQAVEPFLRRPGRRR